MSNKVRNILLLIVILFCLGIAGHMDKQHLQLELAAQECAPLNQASTDYEQCIANHLEINNDR